MITLHDYWRSSAAYRVRIALGLVGEPWESHIVNLLDGSHKAPAHLARHPQGLVPALEIDGLMLTQSLAIIEYLDETRGLGLLPEPAADRVRVRAIAHAIAMDIHPVCNLSVAKFAVSNSNEGITMAGWMQHFISAGLAAVEQMVEGGDRCFGTRVSLADLCLMPQLYNARRWEIDLDTMPRLRRIEAVLSDIPAFASAHPDQSPQA